MNQPRVAIYSAIYGSYEATAKPLPADLLCPAYLFTDSEQIAIQCEHVGGWTAIYDTSPYERFTPDPANGDPALVAPMLAHKFWKTHPLEADFKASGDAFGFPAEITIWLDGNMQIKGSGVAFVDRCLAALGEDDWSVMRHPWRDCIYAEAEYTATVCAYRYSPEAIRRQVAAYEAPPWSHPRGWGLPATGNMVRRHTEIVQAAGEAWWSHNLQYSHQDQLSLPVVFAEYGDRLRYNYDLPWGELWELIPHGL
jgi:alkaline ceramidase TOD1/glycosyltransferase MUCI70-like protein